MENILYEWGLNIVFALVISIGGFFLVRLLRRIVSGILRRSGADGILVSFLSSLFSIFLLFVVAIMALGQLGVKTTSLIAILGAAGLAIGLALQGSLGNLAAGVMIVAFRPFRVGDFIEAGGSAGVVSAVHIFSTTLVTPDNRVVIVPNGAVMAGPITNYNGKNRRRIDLVIGISYGDDIGQAKRSLAAVLEADKRVLKSPEAIIGVAELADSSVNLVLRPWVKGEDYWDVRFALLEAIKNRFDQDGISIPFPQRDIRMKQVA